MVDLPASARVVIIGGGVVGASTLYHLTKMGWSDVVLLEKNELTAGSTWHAAGNCPTFSGSWSIMQMQTYSARLFATLGDDVGYPINYHRTGSVRLAHSQERMREFHHVADMAQSQGHEMAMLSVSDIKTRVPHMEMHDLLGGIWDPLDGDIDPSQLTQAYATGARKAGAKIVRFCPVSGIDRKGGEWLVTTPHGVIRAEIVVNAAGYYAQDVSDMFRPFGGRRIPQVVMAHQYLITEEIEELKSAGQKIPLIRDPDASYYLRQEKHALLLGPYENGGRAHWRTSDDPQPDDFSFQLFPDDLDRIESYIEDACARMPLLGSVGLQKVINGPIPYAPDGNPLIGPMPGVQNAFEACVFTFGIAQSGGAGKSAAEWIVNGETEWDLWSCDPRRFTGFADQEYADAKGKEIYDHEYATHFPHFQWLAGRGKRLSSLHERNVALGAQFGPFAGWERALWYASPGDDTDPAAAATYRRNGPWFDAVARECAAVRDAAGIIDICGMSKFRVTGPGAAAWLETIATGKMPKPGRMSLCYFATNSGRFKTETSVVRVAEDDLFLITAAVAEWHDLEWITSQLPEDGSITISNFTADVTTLLLTGPKARDILTGLVVADLNLPWLSHQRARIAGIEFDMLRVSFAGELGWELLAPVGDAPKIWDALMEKGMPLGLRPFGMYALESMRLEKGYMTWKGDLTGDYTPLELGAGRFVRFDKGDFVGKAALAAEKQRGSKQMLTALVIEAGDCDAPPLSSVWQNGRQIGLITTGGWGHRIGKSVALGMLETGAEGHVEVDIFGQKCRAEIQPDFDRWDPENKRIRA